MSKSKKPFLFFLVGSVVTFFVGCGGGSSGPPSAPKEASKVMVETRDLLLEASFGGMPFQKKADAKQYENRFPEAAKAIADGSVTIVWGKLLKEGVTSPAIVAFESTASTSGGWAVKEDSKLYKVTASDLSSLTTSSK